MSETIRYLDQNEKNMSRALWEEIFEEDGPEFLDYYYKEKIRDNRILVLAQNEELLSMLQLNPYRLKSQRTGTEVGSYYVIAVATKLTCRHRGMMRRLLLGSMTDLRREHTPFVYLMPADPDIYLPFGYRFVYDQMRTTYQASKRPDDNNLHNLHKAMLQLQKADEADYADIAAFCNAYQAEYQSDRITTVRDAEYFRILDAESAAEDGGILFAGDDDRIVCAFAYTIEDGQVYVREPMVLPEYRSAFVTDLPAYFPETDTIHLFGQDTEIFEGTIIEEGVVPTIMLRILDVVSMLEFCEVDQGTGVKFHVIDRFLEENSGVYEVSCNPQKVIRKSEQITDDCDSSIISVTIEDLTDALARRDGFMGIRFPGRFLINEFV